MTAVTQARKLRAGPLALELDGADVRYVRLGGLEVVRRVLVSIRDRSWRTLEPVVTQLEVDDRGDSFTAHYLAEVETEAIGFAWEGTIDGAADARLAFSLDGVARRDSVFNRIGFCVLHPWRETAGARFRGATPGGQVVEGTFPLLVAPQHIEMGVPVSLFPALTRLEIGATHFEFAGGVFECEDQRNWSDASLKTYCDPPTRRLPHTLTRGERRTQSVRINVGGSALPQSPPELVLGAPTGTRVPALGVCANGGDDLPRGIAHLRATVRLGDEWRLPAVLDVPLELALVVPEEHRSELAFLPRLLSGRRVARVLVIAPGRETTPGDLVRLVRGALDGVPVAGGTDLNFCELNRTRPESDAMDGVFWPIDAQVHASDDLSIMETPEAHGEQVRAAGAFCADKPLFVSPVALRRHARDARADTELGGAWIAASVKHLADAGATAITYADPHPVLEKLCALRGAEVLACETTRPLEVTGLAVRDGALTTLLATNLTPQPLSVQLAGDRLELAAYETTPIQMRNGGRE